MKNMFSVSFRKYPDKRKKNNLFTLIIKMKMLLALTIIRSTAHASSLFLSSYRNMILKLSVWVFSLGYFLIILSSILTSDHLLRIVISISNIIS